MGWVSGQCVAKQPGLPTCVVQGSSCSATCPGCPLQQCCAGSSCHLQNGGATCVANAPPPPCVAPGSSCHATCPGCPLQQCCAGSSCQQMSNWSPTCVYG